MPELDHTDPFELAVDFLNEYNCAPPAANKAVEPTEEPDMVEFERAARRLIVEEYKERAAKRFWGRVDKSAGKGGCWPWLGASTPLGYGRFSYMGRHTGAHRVAMELVGDDIPDRAFVCHHCDNPPCCNPAHLFIGTPGDNTRDSMRKGRRPTAKTT